MRETLMPRNYFASNAKKRLLKTNIVAGFEGRRKIWL
jgi:hypothetical protein